MPPPPANPKIYHILHVDRLASVVADDGLLCDALMAQRQGAGTMIGISEIKQRRLQSGLASRAGLRVGDCVPFYFCPRSVMLYLIHRANHPNLAYQGGQAPIIHLEADLDAAISWAGQQTKRWAFTLSNAGSNYFEDRCDLAQLDEINWPAVEARQWSAVKEGKQAEFLIEERLPWRLVRRIGVHSLAVANQVAAALPANGHRPTVEILADWYY
jgi:hypothetical protein